MVYTVNLSFTEHRLTKLSLMLTCKAILNQPPLTFYYRCASVLVFIKGAIGLIYWNINVQVTDKNQRYTGTTEYS